MSETLYHVAGRDALDALRAEGVKIVHRFPGGVVLRAPLARPIAGVTPAVASGGVVIPERLRAEEIGALAYQTRKTEAFRARKANRPFAGVSMDDIISGAAGEDF